MSKMLSAASNYIAVLPGRLRRALQRAVQAVTKSGEPIAYTSVFSVAAAFSFPATFSSKEFPGLLFCHIVRAASGDKVVACWRDQGHFLAYLGSFQSKAGVAGPPEFEGPTVEVKYPETPWWNIWKKLGEYRPKELLIGLLAVVGALLGLRDYFAVLFARPDVHISYTDDGPLNVVEGAQFSVPLSVTSQVRFTPAYVTFAQPQMRLSGGQAIPVAISREILPNLATGVTDTVNLSGTAPAFSRHQMSPDDYQLSVMGHARAGLVRPIGNLEIPNHEVRVWPASPLVVPIKLARAAGTICSFDGEAYISKPQVQGLDAEFLVEAPITELEGINVTAPATTAAISYGTDDPPMRTKKFEFRTIPIDKFEKYTYKIFLYAPSSVTPSSCEGLAPNIKVHFLDPMPEVK